MTAASTLGPLLTALSLYDATIGISPWMFTPPLSRGCIYLQNTRTWGHPASGYIAGCTLRVAHPFFSPRASPGVIDQLSAVQITLNEDDELFSQHYRSQTVYLVIFTSAYHNLVQYFPPPTTIAIFEACGPCAGPLAFIVSPLHILLLSDSSNDRKMVKLVIEEKPRLDRSDRQPIIAVFESSTPHPVIQPRSRNVIESPAPHRCSPSPFAPCACHSPLVLSPFATLDHHTPHNANNCPRSSTIPMLLIAKTTTRRRVCTISPFLFPCRATVGSEAQP